MMQTEIKAESLHLGNTFFNKLSHNVNCKKYFSSSIQKLLDH